MDTIGARGVLLFALRGSDRRSVGTVEAEWGNDDAHRRFVARVRGPRSAPRGGKTLSRRFARLTLPAVTTPMKQIDGLIVLATQQLQDTRVQPASTEHKRTLTWAAFFIMLVLMGAGMLLLLRG